MNIYFLLLILYLSTSSCKSLQDEIYVGIEKYQEFYDLPKLPYKYDEMEPWIDAVTMETHHGSIHAGYTVRMNRALQAWRKSGEKKELSKSSLIHIMKDIEQVPENWKYTLKQDAGGYLNHIFYFASLSPNPDGKERPMSTSLSNVFKRSFPNITYFKRQMSKDALHQFGVGYTWLCRQPTQNYLTIYTTVEEISPLYYGLQPVLVVDFWEHAYFIKSQSKREEYINNWWKIVDWAKVEALFNWWQQFDPKHDEL